MPRGSRRGKYKVVPKEHAELAGEIMALGPQFQSKALAAIKKVRDAEKASIDQKAKNQIQAQVKVELVKLDQAAKSAKAKRKAMGIINPGTMFKFTFKGKRYLGVTLRIPPEEFDSAEDIILLQYAFSDGDLRAAKKRSAKILRGSNIRAGKIVGGWELSATMKKIQESLAETK